MYFLKINFMNLLKKLYSFPILRLENITVLWSLE